MITKLLIDYLTVMFCLSMALDRPGLFTGAFAGALLSYLVLLLLGKVGGRS